MATRSWNRVELMGNLTKDPELRYTPSGAAVCTFSIATNRVFVTDGERKEEADFHRCVSWNKLAELCNQLLKKGTRVFVSGRLQTRSWQDQSGETKYMTEVVIEDMIVVSQGASSGSSESLPTPPAVSQDVEAASVPVETKEDTSTEAEAPEEEPKKEKIPANESISDEDLPF